MSTETQVFYDVMNAFELIPSLGLARLDIDVQRRVVTIKGRVESDAQREAAEGIARKFVGLRALILKISVLSKPRAPG
jgi:osmotically-inducible protein OsmY